MRFLFRDVFFVFAMLASLSRICHGQISPTANTDFYAAPASVSAADGLLANDYNPDDTGASPWTAQLLSAPTNGVATVAADGSFIYTPSVGASGKDSFLYTFVADGRQSNPGTVHLNIGDEPWSDRFSDLPGVRTVNAICAGPNGDVYLGGLFANVATSGSVVNPYGIARWDGVKWNSLGNGFVNGVTGTIYSMQWVGTNLYVSGAFGRAGGRGVSSVARWDGHQWFGIGAGIGGTVYALAITDNFIYAGGQFQFAGSAAATNIARWDGTAWGPVGDGLNGTVRTLALDGAGGLYAGGSFDNASGATATNIARWNGSAWSALGNGVAGQVNAAVVVEGNLFVGGKFTRAGNVGATNVAQWTGSEWKALGNGVKGDAVTALASFQNKLAASISSAAPDASIQLWNGATWLGVPASPLLAGAPRVTTLFADNTRLLAGGPFTQSSNAPIKFAASWDGATWSGFNNAANGNVLAIVAKNGVAYAGGEFTAAGISPASQVAKLQGSQWQTVGSVTNNGVNGTVNALLIGATNELFVGGNFSQAGGKMAGNIAVFDGQNWSALGAATNQLNGEVFALAMNRDQRLFAAGAFTHAGSLAAPGIAMWDGKRLTNVGGGITGRVYAMAVDGPYLYAAGAFTQAGGVSAANIARWDGATWTALGPGPSASGTRIIYAVAVRGTEVFAAGQLNSSSGAPAHLFRWSGAGWSPVVTSISGNGTITSLRSLQVVGDRLYVGGVFDTFNGVAAKSLIMWDGERWKPVGTSLDDINLPMASAIAIDQDQMFVGGRFSTAGRKRSFDFAQFQLPQAAVLIQANTVGASSVLVGSPVTLTAELADRDDLVKRVDYYDGATLIGSASAAPYNFMWSAPFTGAHDVYAHAFGDSGRLAVSQALRVRVFPPAGNSAPTVELTAPANNAVLTVGTSIPLQAKAADADGIRDVRFFAGDTEIGVVMEAPYTVSWQRTTAGTVVVTARARDHVGLETTSIPLTVRWQLAPVVFVSEPREGDVLEGPLDVRLRADARDDSGISRVEFFINGTLLGPTTQNSSPDYEMIWANAPMGMHQIVARAFDHEGGVTSSTPVTIRIDEAGPKMTIELVYPASGARFSAPTNINLRVNVSAPIGVITAVDYFAGSVRIGTVAQAPFNFDWRNVQAGDYCLTAKALDDRFNVVTSGTVCISVTNNPNNPKYTVTDIGTLGGAMSEPAAICNEGQIVGWSYTLGSPTRSRPFLYASGQMFEIGPQPADGGATAINDRGLIALHIGPLAYRLDGGTVHEIPGLGGDYTIPAAMDDNGAVVGTAADSNHRLRAFFYEAGVTTELVGVGGVSSEGRGINNSQNIVGAFRDADGTPHAFFYNAVAGMTRLPAFGDNGHIAAAINDRDEIVGFTGTDTGGTRAFLMPSTNVILDLGALGGVSSAARSINNQGQIVGHAHDSQSQNHAFLWQNAVMFDLNTLIPPNSGCLLVEAVDINDRGDIVAWGYKLPLEQDLPRRAYVLRPVTSIPSMPLPLSLGDGSFHLTLAVPHTQAYRTDVSEDLINWTPAATNFNAGGILQLTDTNSTRAKFYRTTPWNP